MLKIRLQRIGRRNQPYYRLVVTDSRFGPKSGRFIEVIGSYDPKAGAVQVKKERAEYWLAQGAQASDTAFNFLVDNSLIAGKKRNALPKKTAPIKEVVEEAPVAEEAPASEAASEDTPAEEAPVAETEETPAE
ncbi:MAG: 30S ribosomal protein S16 [Candidatus Pacebacteria bacterium]|nr:30S ribosomal protein S16 [Candidatus Paceibacterota bacterium]MCD8563765.1 30S ribosomal protein S16 [Candidatus Paceibacterota bacterium]